MQCAANAASNCLIRFTLNHLAVQKYEGIKEIPRGETSI
jgi:hypothetical protein